MTIKLWSDILNLIKLSKDSFVTGAAYANDGGRDLSITTSVITKVRDKYE